MNNFSNLPVDAHPQCPDDGAERLRETPTHGDHGADRLRQTPTHGDHGAERLRETPTHGDHGADRLRQTPTHGDHGADRLRQTPTHGDHGADRLRQTPTHGDHGAERLRETQCDHGAERLRETQCDHGAERLRETPTHGDHGAERLRETQCDHGAERLRETPTHGDHGAERLRQTPTHGDHGAERLRETPTHGDHGAERLRQTPTHGDHGEGNGGVAFFPPLYIQRYTLALACLTQHNVTSVVDFGCSECALMKLLPTVANLEEIALVDIDKDLLQSKKRVIEPELRHYIFRRQRPLHVMLMAGSADVTDSRLLNYDAVLLIEVIEHLEADILDKVTHNVFGNMTPKLCLVTTPNSEFNVLFDNPDPKQFRHWDHKFEWSRQQFHQWCQQVCHRYGYLVEYSGVGSLTSRPDTDHLGPCSQAAIFTLQQQTVSPTSWPHNSVCYELIAESEFPFEKEILSQQQKIDVEVSYCLRQLLISRRDSVSQGEPVHISISDLAQLYTVRNLCHQSGVRESLHRCNQQISPDGLFVVLEHDDDDGDDDDNADSGGWLVDEEDSNYIHHTCHQLSQCHLHVGGSPGGSCSQDLHDSSNTECPCEVWDTDNTECVVEVWDTDNTECPCEVWDTDNTECPCEVWDTDNTECVGEV